jgi:hypothetical protein
MNNSSHPTQPTLYAVFETDADGNLSIKASAYDNHFDAEVLKLPPVLFTTLTSELIAHFLDTSKVPVDSCIAFSEFIAVKAVQNWIHLCVAIMDTIRLDKPAIATETVYYIVNYVEQFMERQSESIKVMQPVSEVTA